VTIVFLLISAYDIQSYIFEGLGLMFSNLATLLIYAIMIRFGELSLPRIIPIEEHSRKDSMDSKNNSTTNSRFATYSTKSGRTDAEKVAKETSTAPAAAKDEDEGKEETKEESSLTESEDGDEGEGKKRGSGEGGEEKEELMESRTSCSAKAESSTP